MIGAQMLVPDLTLNMSIDMAIPENMAVVHRALLYDLWDVAGLGGIGGATARALIGRLVPHFAREEELVRSIYDLARPDPPGEEAIPEEEDIAVMASYIELELQDLREEHQEFRKAIQELAEVAEAAYDQRLYDLALRLGSHLEFEEEVHFPAASFIGRCNISGMKGVCKA